MKFYTASRLILQDISECRDMMSLQALLFMILFLQSTSNMSDCYSFVGIALRSALRMGLHRHLSHASMTPIDDEQKRRAFHVIRQMDIYISSILGFPILLQEEDIDQLYPTEVDDEYITKQAILTPPHGAISYFQAFNAHARLMAILAKVIKTIYPLKGAEQGVTNTDRPNLTYTINYSRIKEMERELQNWYEKLPAAWRPGLEGPEEVVRCVIYRPCTEQEGTRSALTDLGIQCANLAPLFVRSGADDGVQAVLALHLPAFVG
jgi:hypothetical protein